MSLKKHLRRTMIAGIATLVPLVVTGAFVWWIVVKTEGVSRFLVDKGLLPVNIPGLGLLISLMISGFVIYSVGLLASNYIGRRFMKVGEAIIDRVPIVKTIYTTVKQVADSIKLSRKGLFQEVAFLEYPRKGIWTVGFITSESRGEIQEKTKEKVVNVFVPTTPNPTSGMLVMVPESSLVRTSMSVEEGMRLIISGGIAVPEDTPE